MPSDNKHHSWHKKGREAYDAVASAWVSFSWNGNGVIFVQAVYRWIANGVFMFLFSRSCTTIYITMVSKFHYVFVVLLSLCMSVAKPLAQTVLESWSSKQIKTRMDKGAKAWFHTTLNLEEFRTEPSNCIYNWSNRYRAVRVFAVNICESNPVRKHVKTTTRCNCVEA